MAFDINNFLIDHPIRAIGLSQTDDSPLFSVNQLSNAQLSFTSDSTVVNDALGTPIAEFYRAKTAEFSAENAIIDLNLMAVQFGTEKKVADTGNKILTPKFETIDYKTGQDDYELSQEPKTAPSAIYKLNGDSTLGTKYVKAMAKSDTEFAIDGKTLTAPEGLADGDQLFVIYEYEAENAVSVVNNAKDFPVACKLIIEVLGYDVCDQTKKIFAYVIFDNFKPSPDFDYSFQSDGTHSFSGKAMQNYCSKENELVKIIIPE